MTYFHLSDFDNFELFWKGNGLHKFWKEILANYLHTTRQRKFALFLVFLNYTSGYLKFLIFCIFEMTWSTSFQKWIFYHFWPFSFFAHIFSKQLDFRKQIFYTFGIFLQMLKVERKSFSLMYCLSHLDIKHVI